MRRALARLGLLLAALLPAAGVASEQAARVFERTAPSVYSVFATRDDDASRVQQGSAVVVGPGRVVTNYHVINGATRIRVRRGTFEQPAMLLQGDPAHDLALLQVDELNAPSIEIGGAVRVGQSVYAVGSPRGLELSLSEGIVSSLRTVADGTLIQTTAPISPGSSGGGLFDAEGRLVGLTTAQARDGQNLNFAVPVAWLTRLGLSLAPAEPLPAEVIPVAVAAPPPPALPAASAPPAAVTVTAPPAQAQAMASPRAAPPPEAEVRRTIFTTATILALVLLLARPAVRWLSDLFDRGVPELAPARGTPTPITPAPDRLAPFRQQARQELAEGPRDEALWAQLTQQAGGQDARASAAYVEQRAQRLYRADLDRRWAEAQAQSQGPVPPRG